MLSVAGEDQGRTSKQITAKEERGFSCLFLEGLGDDHAGDGDVNGVFRIIKDREHHKQVAHRDAALFSPSAPEASTPFPQLRGAISFPHLEESSESVRNY